MNDFMRNEYIRGFLLFFVLWTWFGGVGCCFRGTLEGATSLPPGGHYGLPPF